MLTKSKKGNVVCPECRRKMRVPGGKIDNLATNFPLKSLAEHELMKVGGGDDAPPAPAPAPLVRRTTLRRRVTILRERESVMVHRETPSNDDNNQQQDEEELETLRLKIECLEQQLQHHQQVPNEPIYVQLEDDENDDGVPIGRQESLVHRGSFNSISSTPPTYYAGPSAPPLEDEPIEPPPLPDRPVQGLHHSNTLPMRPGAAGAPSHFTSSMSSHLSTPDVSSRCSLPPNLTANQVYQELLQKNGPKKQPVVRKHLQPVEEFGTFEQAQGIALTHDGLIVVCDFKGEAVTVFHRKKKGKVVRKFSLTLTSKNPNRPADVACTIKGGFLVARRTVVELYNSKGKYDRTLPKAFKDTTGVCTVTTATDGRIMVGDIINYAIVIYNSKGDKIVQKISTSTKPARIAALGGILVAASHARFGRLEIFDTSFGQSFKVFEIPEVLGICYDPQTNCILIVRNERLAPGRVECHTGVVEQYNAGTGELKVVLAEGLYHPFHLTFTANGLLAVADKTSVKMFQVKGEGHRESIYE